MFHIPRRTFHVLRSTSYIMGQALHYLKPSYEQASDDLSDLLISSPIRGKEGASPLSVEEKEALLSKSVVDSSVGEYEIRHCIIKKQPGKEEEKKQEEEKEVKEKCVCVREGVEVGELEFDEFLEVFPHFTGMESFTQVVQSLFQKLATHHIVKHDTLRITKDTQGNLVYRLQVEILVPPLPTSYPPPHPHPHVHPCPSS